MDYVNAIDRLPLGVNILLAIFLPVIHFVYGLILDISEQNYMSLALDLVVFVALPLVYWILNLVYVCTDKGPFRFAKVL